MRYPNNTIRTQTHLPDRHRKYAQAGFSLVETLVAITILIVAIVGPMTIAARGLQSAFFAREQLTAVYLAQEGVEIIRRMRDEYALQNGGDLDGAGRDWMNVVPAACKDPDKVADGCGLDISGGSRDCTSNLDDNECRLGYDETPSGRGMYNYGGTLSPYTRVIRVESTTDREAEVSVEVSWQTGLFASRKTIRLESSVFNQYDNY